MSAAVLYGHQRGKTRSSEEDEEIFESYCGGKKEKFGEKNLGAGGQTGSLYEIPHHARLPHNLLSAASVEIIHQQSLSTRCRQALAGTLCSSRSPGDIYFKMGGKCSLFSYIRRLADAQATRAATPVLPLPARLRMLRFERTLI